MLDERKCFDFLVLSILVNFLVHSSYLLSKYMLSDVVFFMNTEADFYFSIAKTFFLLQAEELFLKKDD